MATFQIAEQSTEDLLQRLTELKALRYTTPSSRLEQTAIEDELRAREVIPPRITKMQAHEDDF